MTHNILVNAYRIAPDRIVAGTAGSYGLERMALTFSEEWKDVAKTVTFYPPKSRPVSVVLTDGDEFDIPPEATAKSGEISFTVLGYRDGKRIFSVTGEMLVLATKNKEGVPSEEPTPSEKEQILAYVQDVKEMIDAGKIKGEDGYTPIKGVDYFDGKDGYTPIKGIDYVDGRDGYTPVKGVDYFDGKDGRDGQNGKDGKDGKDGINGKDGTSVAIASITESDEDGGENVVTFSDGNTLTVKNGSKGADGEGGGGVQSDWNQRDPAAPDYVKNRTHYSDKAFEDIVWGGDTEGRDIGYINDNNIFYKVSDKILSVEDLLGATAAYTSGNVHYLDEDHVKQESEDLINIDLNAGVVILAPTTYRGTVFPSTGVYFLLNGGTYHITELKAKETVHKLDPKYLPDDIGGGNSVYFGEEEPTDAKTGDFWYDESEEEEVTQPLTFTGAVEATYDGSKPVVVEIPDTAIPRIEMESTDTTATIEPNTLYVFPEMASLDITLGGAIDTGIVQEYRFRFTSGATATTLTLPADVVGEISVEANKVYEVSILDGYLVSQSWEVS